MKIAATLSLVIASASAFAPSQQGAKSAASLEAVTDMNGLVGPDIECGNQVFDPLGVTQYASGDYLRKAELSNGRTAMLAVVGWVWPKVFGTLPATDVTTTDPVDAILQADPQWWAQFGLLCGLIEAIKYRSDEEGKSYTGEGPALFDPARMWDKMSAKDKETMRLKELKNSRLAMLAFAAFVSAHFIEGSVPGLPLGF